MNKGIEDIIEYLRGYNGDRRRFYVKFERDSLKEKSYVCYGPLKHWDYEEITNAGFGYFVNKKNPDHKAGWEFFNWITSRERSPWRSLLKDDIIVAESEHEIFGYVIGPKTIESWREEKDDRYIFSFLIALALWNENQDHVKFWWKCVSEWGVEIHRAYWYCRDMIYTTDNKIRIYSLPIMEHYPLPLENLDMKRFRESNPNRKHTYIVGIFSEIDQYGEEEALYNDFYSEWCNKSESWNILRCTCYGGYAKDDPGCCKRAKVDTIEVDTFRNKLDKHFEKKYG